MREDPAEGEFLSPCSDVTMTPSFNALLTLGKLFKLRASKVALGRDLGGAARWFEPGDAS